MTCMVQSLGVVGLQLELWALKDSEVGNEGHVPVCFVVCALQPHRNVCAINLPSHVKQERGKPGPAMETKAAAGMRTLALLLPAGLDSRVLFVPFCASPTGCCSIDAATACAPLAGCGARCMRFYRESFSRPTCCGTTVGQWANALTGGLLPGRLNYFEFLSVGHASVERGGLCFRMPAVLQEWFEVRDVKSCATDLRGPEVDSSDGLRIVLGFLVGTALSSRLGSVSLLPVRFRFA